MPQPGPTQDLLALIDTQRSEAGSLLERVTHPSMKELIRQAVRDLEGAARRLHQPDIHDNPPMLELVDQNIRLATWRLTLVRHALETHGPDARIL